MFLPSAGAWTVQVRARLPVGAEVRALTFAKRKFMGIDVRSDGASLSSSPRVLAVVAADYRCGLVPSPARWTRAACLMWTTRNATPAARNTQGR